MNPVNFRKGLFFSFDALIAASILLIAFILVSGISPKAPQTLSEYRQLHLLSEDAMQIFVGTPFSSLDEPQKSEVVIAANLSQRDMDKSLLDIVGILWGINKTDDAANMTRAFFDTILSNATNYSLVIEDYSAPGSISVIYNSSSRASNRRVLSSSSRVVSGYKENAPNTGYVSKAYILGATKRSQEYAYFGGYEGNGEITKVLVLPNSTESISETYMEFDTPSNFSLYINGISAGTYNVSERLPLRAKNWTIPSSYNAYYVNGSNNLTLSFHDINSAYIGGGFIRVTYNTSIMDTANIHANPDGNVTGKYYFPGIEGLINLYSSFYVPGTLKSLGMLLHYTSNYTVYLIVGNVSIYENSTNGTQTLYLNNTYLSSILDYPLFNQTMPIRFGTKNITGLNDGSDVVLITDLSGSMTACDVNATSSDCSGSAGIQNRRIDVAKNSDKEFVNVVLSTAGQKVGLVAYEDTTVSSKTVNLTDNNNTLISMINTYTTYDCTCISCGVQSSIDMLAATLNTTILVTDKSQWLYNDSFLSGTPPLDSEGRNWTHVNYSLDTSWKTGNAVFGNGSYPITIETNITGNASTKKYPDLWDMAADKATPEIDFTSGMNSTANTFGLGAGNDGWDWGAKYNSYDNTTIVYGAAINGKAVFSTDSGSPTRNRCSGYDCSGGYGIQIDIMPEQYATISSGGEAYVSFDYWWNATRSSTFENTDEVWIKARWTSPATGAHWLGSELSNVSGVDPLPEIDNRNNPSFNMTGHFFQNITSWIEGPGIYYLDFGGKLMANYYDEGGNFSFDNVLLEMSNGTDTTYFRKTFEISNISAVKKSVVRLMSDDSAEVYVNGVLVLNNTGTINNAKYWNDAATISLKYLRQGKNIVAAKLFNKASPSRFDLSIIALNDSRNKVMVVMSDGEANTMIVGGNGCNPPAAYLPSQDAIERACSGYANYGIISHSVGFGRDVEESTLETIAECGHGSYYASNDADDLQNIYSTIANAIVSFTTQAAEITGDSAIGKLYPDSFIEYNYTPAVNINYGDISLVFESNTFGNTSGNYSVEIPKNGSYNISSNMIVMEVKATSYSSDYWTSTLEAKNETGASWKTAFNLSTFGNIYNSLGDPYIINIPASLVIPGELNYARINTARNSTEFAGGSPDNRIIYSVRVKGGVDYGSTFNTSEEAKADANARLASYLGTFGISAVEIRNDTIDIGKIPWMWGPAIMTLEVWK